MKFSVFCILTVAVATASVSALTYTITGRESKCDEILQRIARMFMKNAEHELAQDFSKMFIAKTFQTAVEDYDIIVMKIRVSREDYIFMAISDAFDKPVYMTSAPGSTSERLTLDITAKLYER